MASITIHDMLQPQVILDVVSRIRKGQGRLGRWFGFHYTGFSPDGGVLTGPNIRESPVRYGTYRIYDRVRTIAKGRAPGTGPATWQPNPVGEVVYSCARFHEKITLNMEELSNLSPIVGPNSQVDPGGQDYLTQQEETIAERFNNAVEYLTACMIRGAAYLMGQGEDWIPYMTQPGSGPYVTINFQIPSGNLTQLNMLGAGSIIDSGWQNAAAQIMSKHLPEIEQAFIYLHGYPLTDIWVDSITWSNVIVNTEVINTAGSANTPFEKFEYVQEQGNDGEQVAEQVAVLRGRPYLRWHINNEVLVDEGGTDPSYAAGTGPLTQVIPANCALFQPEVRREWVDVIHCGEYVSEAPGQPAVKRPGYYFWHEWVTQPTAVDLIGLLNAIPRLKIPKALALGTVMNF